MSRNFALATCFMLGLVLAGCATPTPYQPADARSGVSGGFSDQRITSNRYRVSFAGNGATSRDTVENYLLYRAAELTVQQGYDSFILADRDVERNRRVVVDRPFHAGRFGYWGPSWRYSSARYGWRTWDPYWGDPFFMDSVDVHTIDRYEAMAEIVMQRGSAADGNSRAFDAREVLSELGATIVRPS
ncbi:MAG: hypothetical protein EON93_04050 [Burkholderiales bacterium]|nr:MAG: hypothetical protein EON93_04050 [Burkholderiales bacterium]